MGDVTPSRADRAPGRRRRGPGWVPNQHGAWAMLVLPLVVGAVDVGASWWHVLLLAAWLSAYLAFYATGLWLKARRRARYLPPVRAYAGTTAVLGGLAIAAEPSVLRWGVVYAPLLAVSLVLTARRADRSVANDLVTVLAASLMAVVARATSRDDTSWLPGGDDPRAWVVAAVLLAYFAGTVPYVKTMIRERGNRRMYAASAGLHGAYVVVAGVWAATAGVGAEGWSSAGAGSGGDASGPVLATALTVLALALAVRAVVVPRRWPTASPRAVGIGEIVACALLAAVLLLT